MVLQGFLFSFFYEGSGKIGSFFGGEVFILLVKGGVFVDEALFQVGKEERFGFGFWF